VRELDRIRADLERKKAGEPQIQNCIAHGVHRSLICPACFTLQQERVERESAPLRYAITSSTLRSRVLSELATRNGGPKP
jgi:hypothetical protein